MRRPSVARHAHPPARGRGAGAVQLAWARDRGGEKVRATALGPADRRGRAPFTCLGCGEELIPHLGRLRTPHFAHRPGSSCPLTSPETALHQDAKERLLSLCADAFAGRRRVRVVARCPACRRAMPQDLAALGDRALAEGAVGSLRADVLLCAGERPGGPLASLGAGGDPDLPLTSAEWHDLEARFRCPDCGGTSLLGGARIARHACPLPDRSPGRAPPRPVAWRGYDGSLVLLGWWQAGRREGGKAGPAGGKRE